MGMGSSMGLSLLGFLGAWTLMMAAMMLPSVAPVAALHARSLAGRGGSLALFVLGYIAIWSALGIPAFGFALGVDRAAMAAPQAVRWGVVAILLAAAGYQLTPLKRLCLDHCRSPLSLILHYGSFKGPLRDLRVGAHHGLYCAGCCWPLMLLLVAVGTMSLGPMLVLTAVIAGEKLLPGGATMTRATGAAAALLAVVIAVSPAFFSRLTG
ncbi:MAG: hypothetical protein NVS9B1_08790 [Candidatus Dormibacteraceae bacterium]